IFLSLADLPDAFAVLVGELRGQHDADRDVEVARPADPARHPLPREPDGPSVLRLGRDAERDASFQRRKGHLGAKERFVHRDRQLHPQVVAIAREDRVRPHAHLEIQVTARPAILSGAALAGEADALSVADARRDLHRERARTPVLVRDLDRSLAALEGLCQRDLELGLEVDARRDARASSGTSAEEILRGESAAAAEERLEEIGEVPETFSVERAAGTGLAPVDPVESTAVPGAARSVLIAGPVRADLVVPAALLGIGEDLVGLVDLLEAPLGLRSSV